MSISQGQHARKCPSDKAGGLQPILYLCKNAKVTLTMNISVAFGLYNGASGTVVDLIYSSGKRPPEDLPDVVMVMFPKYTGPPFYIDQPQIIPITPIEKRLDCSCRSCKRTQIPLRLGWASTIHRCQGLTIGHNESNRYIIIDPGTTAFESRNPGALFVALSRAKSAGNSNKDPDFAWNENIILNEDRLCHVVRTPTTTARTKEINRILEMQQHTREKYRNLQNEHKYINFVLSLQNTHQQK